MMLNRTLLNPALPFVMWLCALQKDVHTGHEHLEVAFEFRKMRFIYNEAVHSFERLKFPVHEPFEYYLKATGV